MKQTAVEYLIQYMMNNQYFIGNDLADVFDKAKAMEKQHVMEFLEEYDSYIFRGGDTSEEEYYNYIYGN